MKVGLATSERNIYKQFKINTIMLKKLLSLFGINKEENKESAQHVSNANPRQREVEDDDLDDDNDNEDEEEEDEWPEEEIGQQVAVELDPITLHGKNYTEEKFDAEVEKRVNTHIADDKADGEDVRQEDIDNYYYNIRKEVYQEWTGANMNQTEQWIEANSMKYRGTASFGNTQHDENNPLLQDIHGVSLQDYGAMSYYIATGADFNAILSQLGIDTAIWQEASILWGKRMAEDTTFTVTTLFSQYYGSADKHPKLSTLAVELSAKGKETIEKMKADRAFYVEVAAAVSAAFEYGIDGSQWLVENYEITNGDLQKVASYYGELDNKNKDMQTLNKYGKLMDNKIEEYKKKFAAEQGGNIADDISF